MWRFIGFADSDLPLVHACPKQGAAPAKERPAEKPVRQEELRRSADDAALRR